jgi:D-serine deaminase-like pyridoxal phosphate-dependent protein
MKAIIDIGIVKRNLAEFREFVRKYGIKNRAIKLTLESIARFRIDKLNFNITISYSLYK